MSKVYDGLGSTLTAGTSSSFVIAKTKINPPSVSGGDVIDITTLENTAWRTKVAKQLKDLGECSFTGIWDSSQHVGAPVNVNELWTFADPDGNTLAFQGALTEFESGDIVEGEFAECTGTITATNFNGTVETAPAYTSA